MVSRTVESPIFRKLPSYLEVVVCCDRVKQVKFAVLVGSEVFTCRTGHVNIPGFVRAGTAIFRAVCTTVFRYVFIRGFTCSHRFSPFKQYDFKTSEMSYGILSANKG